MLIYTGGGKSRVLRDRNVKRNLEMLCIRASYIYIDYEQLYSRIVFEVSCEVALLRKRGNRKQKKGRNLQLCKGPP